MTDSGGPKLTSELHRRAKQVLVEALDLTLDQHTSFLDEACNGDDTLRREVESLLAWVSHRVDLLDDGPLRLAWNRHTVGILDDGPLRLAGRELLVSRPTPEPYAGQRIGPYEIERVLGEGGMGTVALAKRKDDFAQRVALKLIKPGMLSDEVLSRFHMERQILANLEHPNVAAIHDGGTDDGVPYFAMEYVEGEPIDRYCEAEQLSIRERLELFRQVCSTVQVAHQNLVVHRDLKPGNILVTADGVPKLIDFGIAKPLGAELAEGGLVTATGSRPMTPKYASPEQILGERITPASDVYSLGVVLFELLTGELPYAVDSSSFVDLVRVITEVEPRRPSTAVRQRPWHSTDDEATAERGMARSSTGLRRSRIGSRERRRLARRLAGDLDSIVLKALRKDRHNRYSSVEQLSEDLRRHLAGRPVSAREGTVRYRATKYLRRNWRQLSAATVLLAVVAASATMKIQADRRIQRVELDNLLAAQRAGDAERQADVLSALLENLFSNAFKPDESGGEPPTIAEILKRGRERITAELASEPRLLATQLEALAAVYRDLGHYDQERQLLQDTLRLRRRSYESDHPLVARALNNLAARFYRTGEERRAEILYQEALNMKMRLGQKGVDLNKTRNNLGTILMNRGEYARAEKNFRIVLQNRLAADSRLSAEVAASLLKLGTLFFYRGDFESAKPLLREAAETRALVYKPEHTKVAAARRSLARVALALGHLEEAQEHLAAVMELQLKLLGEDHLELALTRKDLASLHLAQGDPAAAERLLEEALAVIRRWQPQDSWEIADAESLLGACLTAARRFEEAEVLLRRSYLVLREKRSEQAIHTRDAFGRLERLYAAWGKPLPALQGREAPRGLPTVVHPDRKNGHD